MRILTKEETLAAADRIEGWMLKPELEWLYDRAKEESRGQIIEFGTWKGKSAFVMGHANGNGRVWCVDHFRGGKGEDLSRFQKQAQTPKGRLDILAECAANLQELMESDRVVLAVMDSYFAMALRSVFRMAFIDASHDYPSAAHDISIAKSIVQQGGLICGHDYDHDHPGVMNAVAWNCPGFTNPVGSIWAWRAP